MVSAVRVEIKSDVRCGSHEFIKLLRSIERIEIESLYDASKDKKLKAKKEKKRSKKEDKTMKKIMHIEGMMCGHCEAAVKKALEALPQVDEAVVSHEAGTAELTLNAEIADDVLKKTVEDKDYTVTSVE